MDRRGFLKDVASTLAASTPLAWRKGNLALWQEAGWSFSFWNLRGSFGILDSGREDVACEDNKGHKLDRASSSC